MRARAGARRAARRPRARRHPDVHVRHRLRRAQDAPLPGRLAPPHLDRHRRPAGLERVAPLPTPAAPSLWGMTPETVTDPDLQEVAWDLSDLLDGARRRRPGRRRRAARPRRRRAPTRSPPRYAGKVAVARRSRPDRRDAASSPRSRRSPAAPAPTRTCRSPSTPPTPRAARCCSASRRRAPRSRPRCCSSTSSGRRSTTRAPRSCSPPRPGLRPPPPRHRAPLPAAPAHRARGEDPHREGAQPGARPGCGCSRSRRRRSPSSSPEATSPSRSRSRSRASSTPDREVRRDDRRGRDRGAAARPAHARATRSTRCSRTR